MKQKFGIGAIKVGDTLYGFYRGAHRGYPKFKEVQITKVGNKYVYGNHLQKLEMTFDNRWYPQYYDQLATDSDGYQYYKTLEAAERGYRAKSVAIELLSYPFRNVDDSTIFQIAELLNLKENKQYGLSRKQ